MYSNPGMASSIQGQMLRQNERREVAIFLRDGQLLIADFIDGQGQVVDAATWFRFNCGVPSTGHARRRMVLESATPLSEALVARIERLLRPAATPPQAGLERLVSALAAFLPRSRLVTAIAHRFDRRRAQRIDASLK